MAEDKDCLGYGASAEVYSLMLLLNGCCGFNYSVTLRWRLFEVAATPAQLQQETGVNTPWPQLPDVEIST